MTVAKRTTIRKSKIISLKDCYKNRDVTNKNFTSLNDSVLILENHINNLENVVKVAVVVTVFCHIWKKMRKKKELGSDEKQAENGQK